MAAKAKTGEAAGTVQDTGKTYRFMSKNKYLSVASLGIQFIDGLAETKDLGVARALATIDGVALAEG